MESNSIIGSDDICIAVVGPTGAGKTSTINSIIAQLVRPNFKENRAIAIGQRIRISNSLGQSRELAIKCNIAPFSQCQGKNMSTNLMESQTGEATAYSVQFDNFGITLIDSPGITDTNGREQEKANVEEWVRGLNKVGSFNVIALVVKASENRIDASTQRMVSILKTLLPEKYKDNIVVFFTHVISKTAVRGSEILKAMNIPFSHAFYFENSCILSANDYRQQSFMSPEDIEEIDSELFRYWNRNQDNIKHMLQTVQRMLPQSVVHINEVRCQLHHLSIVMAQLFEMAINLMTAFQELKTLAKEKSVAIKNINEVEAQLKNAEAECLKYDKSLMKKGNQEAFTQNLETGVSVAKELLDLAKDIGIHFLEEASKFAAIITAPVTFLVKIVISSINKRKEVLQKKKEQTQAALQQVMDKLVVEKDKQGQINTQIDAFNNLQTEIVREVQKACRSAIYLYIKANSALMQSNTSKGFFIDQMDEGFKAIKSNGLADENFKEAVLVIMRYLKEDFEDYEKNYGLKSIDSFLNDEPRRAILAQIQQESKKYSPDPLEMRRNTLVLRRTCPLY